MKVVDHVVVRDRFLHLARLERRLERQLHRHDQPDAPQPGERGLEERTLLVVRASDELAVCSTVGTTTSPGST